MPKESVEKRTKLKTNQPLELPPVPNKPQQCKRIKRNSLELFLLIFLFIGHFFVARKRRYCNLPAKKLQKYCGEHMTQDPENQVSNLKRIPCPYDNSQ